MKTTLDSFILEVQQQFGRRPFFIYDLDGMNDHLSQFKIPGVKFWYATKANPLSSVIKTAYACGFGIDCASRGEFNQALKSGVSASEILLTGPAKSKALLKEALEVGIETFVLESVQQALDLEGMAIKLGKQVKALLRLQLKWDETDSSVLGGNQVTPFGLDSTAWMELRQFKFKQIQMKGVHCFQWGNILDLDRLSEIWLKISKEAFELSSCLGFDLEVLDLGGGIGIPYQEKGIKSADVKYEALKAQLLRLKQRMPDTQIWMELGRYAIGPFGKYVTDIVDRKTVHGVNVLVTEGGVHHLLRPALVGEAFPATLLQSEAKEKKQILFEIHGPLCTALDHLGQFHLSAGTQSGDSLVFHQCGAYGFTESMPFFLCHDLPAEFVVKENVLRQVRNWQSPEGWLV